eukprot:CAMPEP_0194324214 /NCGR_PEP_ID=MMETSP0171-20130528/26899_1 /TAXON_ID=218684 /ORGANISM="Corethron pennatum, Strain L29A3" /LENGTH=397 /DNA_ID=CAMNT_0039083053 /DNA_START=25 /DNA_END=1218 /DNA_ORIENTATION=+
MLFRMNSIAVAAVCGMILSAPVAYGECKGLESSHDWQTQQTFSRGDGKPDRTYHVHTPPNYKPSKKSKVLLFFHGWGESGKAYLEYEYKLLETLNRYNYVYVGIDGLGGTGDWDWPSWNFPGSSDGIGSDGTSVTTCDTSLAEPDYCYKSQCPCTNRCGWTHCIDDDVQMVADFINGGVGLTGSLSDVVCVDPKATFASGVSNGGMLAFFLGSDPRTAPLLSGIAPIIALPHGDYNFAGDVPILLQVGRNDPTVTPHSGEYPGDPSDTIISNIDNEYYYITGHRITTTWATKKCVVTDSNAFPTTKYKIKEMPKTAMHKCRTWCQGKEAYSVDCTFKGAHDSPGFTYQAALIFFDRHLPKKKRSDCWKLKTRKSCEQATCTWRNARKKCRKENFSNV